MAQGAACLCQPTREKDAVFLVIRSTTSIYSGTPAPEVNPEHHRRDLFFSYTLHYVPRKRDTAWFLAKDGKRLCQFKTNSILTIMKKNSYYIVCGVLAVLLVALLYLFIQIRLPLLIIPAILIAVFICFILRRRIPSADLDEREILIDMKTASATLKIGAALIIVANLPIAVFAFSVPPMIMPMPHFQPPEVIPLGILGQIAIFELLLLAAIVLLYAGIYIYYSHKYGGDIADEE
ncbi:MAG TPA: DUF2178 domain-containing protein [Methanocorpusculum sp.]|nr:DUF2178 domain-containing protein [Methanocorpusculum sp.]